jgi:hypothetical protein
MNRKLRPGHGWAYFGVLVGLAASITGNVAHTVLADSTISLQLRVPLAVLWPVMLLIGIEVLTRVDWTRNWRHWFARLLLVGPVALVSAFVSYLHLFHLMGMAGETELAQYAGPLAVDGTLFGCTVALLVTRAMHRDAGQAGTSPTLAQRVANIRTVALDVKDAAKGTPALPVPVTAIPAPALPEAPVSLTPALPIPVSPAPTGEPRRRGQWDAAKAVRLIQEGDLGDTDIGSMVSVSPKMIQRTRRAVRLLTADPHATVPADWKVPGNVVDIIRREVQR